MARPFFVSWYAPIGARLAPREITPYSMSNGKTADGIRVHGGATEVQDVEAIGDTDA